MMALRGPVLAAIDLTDAADEVLAQASAMATCLQTRLIVCHMLHEMLRVRMLFPQLAGLDTATQAVLEQRARDAVEARVAAVTQRSTTDFEVAVDSGSAHAGILGQAEQVGAVSWLSVRVPSPIAWPGTRRVPCSLRVPRCAAACSGQQTFRTLRFLRSRPRPQRQHAEASRCD